MNPGQLELAAKTLTDSFLDYPLLKAFFPDPKVRKGKCMLFYRLFLRYGLSYGRVRYSSPQMECVSIWLPPEAPLMTLSRQLETGGFDWLRLGPASLYRMARIAGQIDAVHRELNPEPHWYLAGIGTNPAYRGNGYASSLIGNFLQLERGKTSCYLETFVDSNVSYYQGLGFHLLESRPLDGCDLVLNAMRFR